MTAIAQELIDQKITKLTPFKELNALAFQEAIKSCQVINLPARKKLFKRGEPSEYSYYLINGKLNLIDKDFNSESYEATDPRCLNPLDDHKVHLFSAVTVDDCELLQVHRDQLSLAMTRESATMAVEESVDNDSDWMSSLLQSDVFANVPPTNIQRLFTSFQGQDYGAGSVIISEGQIGDQFFVIHSGSVKISSRTEAGEQELATLYPGQFFGEEALIGETTRNATATMATPGKLMLLAKDDFKQLLEQPVMNSISEQDLATIAADGTPTCVLDVRLGAEFRHSHHPDSINIPLNRLRDRLSQLDSDTLYAIPDSAGHRSELGVYLLVKAGFQAFLLNEASEAQ